MITRACLAALVTAGAVVGLAEGVLEPNRDVLVATDQALADILEVGVVLATGQPPRAGQLVDSARLQARIEEVLTEAGLKCAEDGNSSPKLVVQLEGLDVPECDRYVYRVQVSLHRLMALAGRTDRWILTGAWQVRPVMKAVPQSEAREAMAEAVLTQVEAFVGAWKGVRELSRRGDAGARAADGLRPMRLTQAPPQNLQAVSQAPFVASRNSSVFHRADCRWAQNISKDNLVGYASREEAVRAGKRPCKSCKP